MIEQKVCRNPLLIGILIGGLLIFYTRMVWAVPTSKKESSNPKIPQSPATIQEILVHESGTTKIPLSLTPQKDYDIRVLLHDGDGIGNPQGGLNELIVKLWFDSGNSDELLNHPDQRMFETNSADNPKDCVTIKWVRGGTAVLAGAGETWKMNFKKSILPKQEDVQKDTFEFVFNIKIGKVAREASMSHRWQIAAKVSDVAEATDYKIFKGKTGFGLPMDFYGEILFTPQQFNMNVTGEQKASTYPVKKIAYIANGRYDQLARVSPAEGEEAISLKQNKERLEVKSHTLQDLKTAKMLPINGKDIPVKKNITATAKEAPEFHDQFLFVYASQALNQAPVHPLTVVYSISNSLN